jgi:hypothetical protein
MALVMLPCSARDSFGRLSSESSVTLSGVFLVIFPFKLPRLGHSMSSAQNMSSFVMGQLGLGRPLHTI